MLNSPFSRWFSLVTGGVIAGEALAVLVGMHLLSGSANPWISVKNDGLIILDLAIGLGIALIAIRHGPAAWEPVLLVDLVLLGLVTHGYRELEYLARAANPFLANPALFVINNVKLLALLVLAGLTLPPFIRDIRDLLREKK